MASRKKAPRGEGTTGGYRMVPVGELNPAEYNPRVDLKPGDPDYERIRNSFVEFGVVEPLVVNSDGTVIGGHQRLKVLIELGMEEVPCMVVDLDKVREKALNLALNKATGEWDFEMLSALLEDLKTEGYDLMYTGFDELELEGLLGGSGEEDAEEFDPGEQLSRQPFSRPGDLWLLGPHRAVCGDATLPGPYERVMDGEKANLVLTDPPYNVNVEEKAGKIMNDNMADAEFHAFLFEAFSRMYENIADDGTAYVFHADTEGLNFRTSLQEAGFLIMQMLVWKKDVHVLGRSPYQWKHEVIAMARKKKGTCLWYGGRKQTTVWEFPKPLASAEHPTMKPVPMLCYAIRNSTQTNGVVLDPFLGSGSTLIACHETGRVCRGMELDPRFMDVIVARYLAAVGGESGGVSCIRDGRQYALDEVLREAYPEGEVS